MKNSVKGSTDPLSSPIQYLKGIGPKRAAVLEGIGIRSVWDLLFYVPRRYLDRSTIVTIADLRRIVIGPTTPPSDDSDLRVDYTVVGDVRSFRIMGFGKKARFVLVLGDQTGTLQCVWFGGVQYWKSRFRIGEVLAVSGQPTTFGSILQFVHPDIDKISDASDSEGVEPDVAEIDWSATLHTGGLVPLYPSGKELEQVGLDSGGFRRIIRSTLQKHRNDIEETIPEALMQKRILVPLKQAMEQVHFPESRAELEKALSRLKYEEFFFFQLLLALKRQTYREEKGGITFDPQSTLARALVDSLPFKLTHAQTQVIKEIAADMESSRPMNRLLQGDVGSGKTIVALIAALIAVDNGYQCVFMAPTEILAEQHYRTIGSLLEGMQVNVRLLVGAQRSRVRRDILEDVRRGSAQIAVGTHALLEEQVEFANLGLIVIDEQHRFGVMQRATLRGKGTKPDVLVMTATPIPRTLSLTLYGDLDVSIIDELPKNRRPVKTVLKAEEDKKSVFHFVREQVKSGRQAYFVYPLVEESEKLDLKAATVHFEELQLRVFPGLRLALIHGRMTSDEKDAVMMAFKNRDVDILVATTVIEVGIDIPNASVMVIENAERFGLSQLHQLRGRVGRGQEQSYCILLTKKWLVDGAERLVRKATSSSELMNEEQLAQRRLATMVSTTDGFKVAEVDLQLRGPGDFFGTRQSGLPQFKVANILTDSSLLDIARADAFQLVEKDPHLQSSDHQMMIDHLQKHFRDTCSLARIG